MSRTTEIFGRPIEVEAFVIVPSLITRGRFSICANKDRMFYQEIEEKKQEIINDRPENEQNKKSFTIQEVTTFLEFFSTLSTRICVG